MRLRRAGRTHLAVPDTQIGPGRQINHIYWLAHYALDKRPDVVVLLGDWYDLPSLSTHEKRGHSSTEKKRLRADLDAGARGLDILGELWDKHRYNPERHVVLGNHENRLQRAIDADPHLLEGMASNADFKFKEWGWRVHPFLQPVNIDGVRYCHFFPHNSRGEVTQTKNGAPNARAQVQRQMKSATAGHKQGLDVAVVPTVDGLQRGIISGSFYLHNEEYMGPLNNYWRGLILKHGVYCGDYSLCEVDLPFLASRYRKLEPPGRKIA